MTTVATREISTEQDLRPFARLPVGLLAGAVAVLLLVTSAFGGYQFDELYFIAAGDHFAWGYADQPWLVPLLASVLNAVFPGSTLALRLPVTLAGTLGVLLTALIARELGGGRRAQFLAAATYAVAFGALSLNHQLATSALDPLWWLAVCWLVVRWVRTRSDVLLLWAGVVTALALQTKFLIPLLWLGIALGVLLFGPRSLVRRPLLWLGAVLAVAATVPTLLWQVHNGWPYLEFTKVVGLESNRLDMLFSTPFLAGLLGTAAIGYALWRLVRSPRLADYRFLGVAFVVVVLLVVVLDGRAFYPVGLYGALFAVAAVELERAKRPRWLAWVGWPLYVLSAVVTAAVLVFSALTSGVLTSKTLAQPIADAYHSLPDGQRAHTAIVADIYPTAALLQHYAGELRLPRIYSHHRGYYFFGEPADTATDIVYARSDPGEPKRLLPYFRDAKPLGGKDSKIWLLTGRTEDWSTVWPKIQTGLAAN